MRSLNVRKIVALAAGTALTAAAFAAAGPITYSNTPIISASGVPQVKVAVGEKGAASDGVVAANIAAMIGNLAWRSQAVTANVAGTSGVGCTVAGGAGGAGTCSISNEKVWLNVTLPGVVSGAIEFRTLINDWVDKKLENRNESSTDDQYYQSTDLSPLEDLSVTGNKLAVKKFTASDFPALATGSITDTYANVGYTEEQTLWARAITKYDDGLKKIIGFAPDLAYQIKFTHDAYGIPIAVCNPSDGAIFPGFGAGRNTTETDRVCSDTDRTDRHRVQVKFLGENYIISDMNPPATNVTDGSETTAGMATGGSIRLAKESAYGIVHVGENLSTGSYYVKLADITTPTTTAFQTFASIEIYDMNNNLLKEDKIIEGGTYSWTAPDGSKIRIRDYKNNPGYYAYAKWAELAIYSKEFELRHGEKISEDCTNWYVYLTWKNKDPSKLSKYVDSLRKILLKNENHNSDRKMVEGDTENIVCSPVVWQLQYNGLTLADPGDYDTLGLAVLNQKSFKDFNRLTGSGGVATDCVNKTKLPDVNVLRVVSGLSQPFTLSGAMTDDVSTFYINLGTNLLNTSYGYELDFYPYNASYLTVDPWASWGSQTTFKAVGYATDGTLLQSTSNTTDMGSGSYNLYPSVSGKNWRNLTALVATGGVYGNNFSLAATNSSGTWNITGQENLSIGRYNDAGEVIWTSSGEDDCDFRMAPTSVDYDMGDGTRQPILFGMNAATSRFVGSWCEVNYINTTTAPCQQDIDGINGTNERAFAWRENAGNSPINYDYVRLYVQQRAQAGAKYQFVDPISAGVMGTTPGRMNYTGVGVSGPGEYEGSQSIGFITDRGTKFTSMGLENAAFKVAKKVGEAQYFMKTSGVSPTEPIQVGPLAEGESTVGLAGGIVIKVTQIAEDVGTCTAVQGGAQCTVTGLDGLSATPSVTSTVIPTDLDTATNKLVVLDRNADRAATLIVVGGNTVNTIADEIIRSSNIDLRTDTVVVRAIGTNRILVAGYSAQDTVTAGDQFIQALIAAKT